MALNILRGMSPAITDQLRAFYVEHRQQLFTYALSITRHREGAEDAIHAAFQGLLRRGKLVGELRPYVFRCVRNAALDGQRRAVVRGDMLFLEDDIPAEDAAPRDRCAARDLDEKLQTLSPDEREAIVLKIYDEFTFQEIADLRGVPLPTVASWYRRGLEKLKTLLQETP